MQLFAMRGHWVFRNVNLLHLKCIFNLYALFLLSMSFQPVGLSDREVISRLRNCLLALAAHKVLLYDTSVLYCYESSVQHQVGSISSFNSTSFFFLISPIASQMESNRNENVLQRKVDFSFGYYVI